MSSKHINPLLQTGLFILVSYIRRCNIKMAIIPIDIEFIILKNTGIDILLQFHIYFINTMITLQQYKTAKTAVTDIRKHILLHGCPENDIISEKTQTNPLNVNFGNIVPTIRKNEDTTRGKLWKLFIGLGAINSNKYQELIQKGRANQNCYLKIRYDTKRTFLTSLKFSCRVSEIRLVRLLNSYVHEIEKQYLSTMDTLAAVLLYVMPELDAYESFLLLVNKHAPTYFYTDRCQKLYLVGSYAASFLAWDILKICDEQLFEHLKPLPPHTYFFPLVSCFQTICQPFTEIPKLWDFLFCFGFHLCPVMAAAHIISNRKQIIEMSPAMLIQTLLSGRKFMRGNTNAKDVINCTVKLIEILQQSQHEELWNYVFYHTTDLNIAMAIKSKYEILTSMAMQINFSVDNVQENENESQTITEPVDNTNVKNNLDHVAEEKKNDDVLESSQQNNLNVLCSIIKMQEGISSNEIKANTDTQINESVTNDDMINDEEVMCKVKDENEMNILDASEEDDNVTESSTDGSSYDESTDDTTDSSSSSDSSDWNYISYDTWYANAIRGIYNLYFLHEFELKDEEIEMFHLCQEKHNQGISENHEAFEFVDKNSMNDEIITHWKTYYSADV